jgi:LuxR family maltose regulon positive regulatory protein
MGDQSTLLARTKFSVPSIPNASVRRDALIARLDAATGCPLTLVVAAPGSGKTALLVQWVEQSERPVAWMSCDLTDADPLGFWRNLATAVGLAWTDAGMAVAELADSDNSDKLAIGLANALGALAQPGAIVIDDFYLARPEPRALLAFITALPPQVRLLLGSRRDPPFPVSRLRLQGRMFELRQADLRLTAAEARQLLTGLGVAVEEHQLEQITSFTEGWTAGVHLAGLWLRDHRDPAGLVRGLAETDRALVDFLINEVIDVQTPEIVEFLMTTAELESFDAALCDAVRDRHDSAEMLRQVRAANLFLTELDSAHGWYRYHHLFTRFLRGRLRAVTPERVSPIHRAAAEAFSRRGDPMNAIHHSLAAGDSNQALDQMQTYIAQNMSLEDQEVGRATVRAWLQEHGTEQVSSSPESVLRCTIILNVTADGDYAEPWLRAVEAREPDLDAGARFMLHGARGFDRLLHGDPQAALRHARRAEDVLADGPVSTSWVHALPNVLIQAQLWLDDLDGAEATIEAARHDPASPAVLSQVRVPGFTAHLEALRGELTRAERLATSSLTAADQLGLPDHNLGLAEPHLAVAMVSLERNRLDDTEDHLERLMCIVEGGRRPPLELLAHTQLASLAQARGDESAAAEAIDRARAVLPDATGPVIACIDRAAVGLALDRGDQDAATALASRLPQSPMSTLLAARVRLADGDRRGAGDLLNSIPTQAMTRRLEIEHSLLRALTIANSDAAAAHDLVHQALGLAEPVGFHRTLVTAGPGLWRLLESLPAHGRTADYVAGILHTAHGVVPAPWMAASRDGPVDQLSERERTVLRYLASRLTSTEIARELYLSVNTVRSHVKTVYRKLGVNSRADAVARGHAVGMI